MGLRLGSVGPQVEALQRRLEELFFRPGLIDGQFGPGTEAAVLAFQRSIGLLPDGVVGPRTAALLGLELEFEPPPADSRVIPVSTVSRMFPATPLAPIKRHLPVIVAELVRAELRDKPMALMALATIRAETESFEPIHEGRSRFNTSPAGHSFDLYDSRQDLGNRGPRDGETFRGRGFIQLTGRANYTRYSQKLGLGERLVEEPDLANDPEIAARLLAQFLKDREIEIKRSLLEDDLRAARRFVNGGSHGLDRFSSAYRIGQELLPNDLRLEA